VQRASGAALVFGGASGIGGACAEALGAVDWPVVIVDRRPAEGDTAALKVDVRDREAVAGAVEHAVREYGSIGTVVYAAGTARVTPLLEIEQHEWELIIGVNLNGAFNVLQACAPHIPSGGSFTAISSIDVFSPVEGLAHYCAAKAGLDALVRSAALELGPSGVRCNAVLPGLVRTPLMESILSRSGVSEEFISKTPLGRIAEGGEIADVVVFLASAGARWITGASIPVDGGQALTEVPSLFSQGG
jgi:3-oxoacyl-[acyl-carrier protein] reductase